MYTGNSDKLNINLDEPFFRSAVYTWINTVTANQHRRERKAKVDIDLQ